LSYTVIPHSKNLIVAKVMVREQANFRRKKHSSHDGGGIITTEQESIDRWSLRKRNTFTRRGHPTPLCVAGRWPRNIQRPSRHCHVHVNHSCRLFHSDGLAHLDRVNSRPAVQADLDGSLGDLNLGNLNFGFVFK
jgi:hypothetical protein